VHVGIWGGKGQGKTFQCNLAFKKLDIGPIVMSAGELESGNAGEPAKLVRQRYREVMSGCSCQFWREPNAKSDRSIRKEASCKLL